ncbi:chromosome condensation regulator RCC1 [Streptomyces yunnanensis]|uniref:Chromosome condensation regulator RCC1 n=1 Tax=Streptomyces yunnanensis TaxID=156453 RepID=A0ABY8AHN8_9ACTN|nr:chromosome condensation regulator RCC1 [Streptomyces yunnanensis]WEB44512.1 chromosome condensation regulator RCC1 [Streptomyces yunnanensis]
MCGAIAAAAALIAIAGTAAPAAAGTTSPDPWVYSWGQNASGELGNGSTVAQQTPGPVLGLAREDVKELEAGGAAATGPFAVALLKNGTVKSWGDNAYGQLGNGTTTSRSFPAAVAGLDGIRSIAVGCHHALALKNGRVWAWGRNENGQLGDGTTSAKNTGVTKPVAVQGLDKVKAIAAGCHFSLALRQDGTVWAWGANSHGQLGNGNIGTDRNTPQQVPNLEGVTALAPGAYHSAVLTSDHKVKTWGYGGTGDLGNDSTANSSTPVDVQHLEGVAKLYGGTYHSYAVLEDGTVKGWGRNGAGQLGDGTKTHRTTAVSLDGLTGVRELAPGVDHTLALRDDQSVVAWGANVSGQLGNGSTEAAERADKPVAVLPAHSGANHLAVGRHAAFGFAY